jgi:hypothetical protein
MINNLIHRGRDPLQAIIDDKKEIDFNSSSLAKIKNNSVTAEEYFEREER